MLALQPIVDFAARRLFGEAAGRLPNSTLFAVGGMKAETAVIAFDLEGITVSSGALGPWRFPLRSCAARCAWAWVGTPERPISSAFLPLAEGLQTHYVEGTVLPPKWLDWGTFSRPFEMVQTANMG